jgi:polyisoprenyl-phosphate glycosyltransferase
LQLPERSRYMKGLFAWIGLPVEIISYHRDARAAGETKWSFFGLCRLAMEGIVSFSVMPLRAVTWLGGVTALSSVGFGVWIACKTFLFGEPVPGYPSIIVTVTFIGGVQLISIGLLGEYMARVYVESKQRPIYVIQNEFSADEMGKNAPSGIAAGGSRV